MRWLPLPYSQMGCCSYSSPPPQIPRVNGLTWPPHPNQIIYWIVLILYEIVYNGILVPSLNKEWQVPAYIILGIAFVAHLSAHVRVLVINPANLDLIQNWPALQPEFDKARHTHVVENQHCNVCQIFVPEGGKHCGKCNKCVTDFDHHCTWLNTCIGGRNYMAFLACVSTTVVWCTVILVAGVVLIVMYFVDKSWLSPGKSDSYTTMVNYSDYADTNLIDIFINASFETNTTISESKAAKSFVVFVPVKDEVWLATVILSTALSGYIDGLVIYLLGFHFYLICTGQSTYHVTRKDQTSTTMPKRDGPLKKSIYLSCWRKNSKMKCRVSAMKRTCAKEDAARLDMEASAEDNEETRHEKDAASSSAFYNEDNLLPSLIT